MYFREVQEILEESEKADWGYFLDTFEEWWDMTNEELSRGEAQKFEKMFKTLKITKEDMKGLTKKFQTWVKAIDKTIYLKTRKYYENYKKSKEAKTPAGKEHLKYLEKDLKMLKNTKFNPEPFSYFNESQEVLEEGERFNDMRVRLNEEINYFPY